METYKTVMPYLLALAYAMPRFLVAFSIIPLLTREALPPLLRVGVVASIAMMMVPGLLEEAMRPRPAVAMLGLIAKEGLIGMALGFLMAIPLWAFDAMGDLADTQRGANMAQILNPLTGHESSPLGQLFTQAIVTFLFATGGFTAILAVIYQSYAVWPVFAPLPAFGDGTAKVMLSMADRLMYLAVLLAAPAIFAMFIAEAGLAIVSRFAPQLQVFFLAMPIKSALAMLVFAVYSVILFDYAGDLLGATYRDTIGTLKGVFLPQGRP